MGRIRKEISIEEAANNEIDFLDLTEEDLAPTKSEKVESVMLWCRVAITVTVICTLVTVAVLLAMILG